MGLQHPGPLDLVPLPLHEASDSSVRLQTRPHRANVPPEQGAGDEPETAVGQSPNRSPPGRRQPTGVHHHPRTPSVGVSDLDPNGTPVHLSEDVNKSDVGAGIRDAILFKEVGGGSIVDVTPLHTGRNPDGLARIASESGVNVVMGTAHYTAPTHTPDMDMDNKSLDDIARVYVDEITGGVGGTGVKPGIIGEVGCSWPLAANERKCLQAASLAQQETGVAVSIHPGFNIDSPLEIVAILTAAGVKPERIILGHMECSCPPGAGEMRLRLADAGCYLQFDSFGVPAYAFPSFLDIPTDGGRVDQIAELVRHGHWHQVLISQDYLANSLTASRGGPGYLHIPKVVVPLMREKGLSESHVRAITVDNPARALSIS